MSVVTISLSDSIAATLQSRAEAAGLSSTEEYLVAWCAPIASRQS